LQNISENLDFEKTKTFAGDEQTKNLPKLTSKTKQNTKKDIAKKFSSKIVCSELKTTICKAKLQILTSKSVAYTFRFGGTPFDSSKNFDVPSDWGFTCDAGKRHG